MMKLCDLFDKYRDGELSRIEKRDFEAHLAECSDCRAKMSLLNNLAFILKQDPVDMTVDLSGQIARKAFQQNKTWDALVIGWLRPGPVFAALALVCVLFSTLWLIPNYRQTSAFSEYEKLIDEANSMNLDSSISRVQKDMALIVWTEQGGKSQ